MLKYGLFPGPSPSAAHYGTQHIKSAAKSISKNDFEKCASFWNTSRGNQGNNKRVQKHYNLLFFLFLSQATCFLSSFWRFFVHLLFNHILRRSYWWYAGPLDRAAEHCPPLPTSQRVWHLYHSRQEQGHFIQLFNSNHRRRTYTEEKVKVVAAVWGTPFIQFLCRTIAILHQDDLKNRMNSSFSSYPPGTMYPFLHIIGKRDTK